MAVKRYYAYVNPYIIQEGDATIASVDIAVADSNGDVYDREFSGNSVRNPIDRANPDAGALIALGRALQRAGSRLEKVGNNLNKHDADIKVEQAKQANKPVPDWKLTGNQVDQLNKIITAVKDTVTPEQAEEIAKKLDGEVYD